MTAVVSTAMFLLSIAAASDRDTPTAAEQAALVEGVSPSLVRVEYTLQYDKGEAPSSSGLGEPCPNCGRYHSNDAEQMVREERPLEMCGFLIAPRTVVTGDPLVHPRFVQSIAVRSGENRAPARTVAWANQQHAAFLELTEPLPGTRPLTFDQAGQPPYLSVSYRLRHGTWTRQVGSFALMLSAEQDRRFCAVPNERLVVTAEGVPVALTMTTEFPPDDTWKGSPEKWPTVSAEDYAKLLAQVEKRAADGVLRVELSFRSPKEKGAESYRYSYRSNEDEESTERNVTGVLVDERRVMVLALLPARTTARLERILVHPPAGEAIPARFVGSSRDYGCLIAELEKPVNGALSLSTAPVVTHRDTLLLEAEIRIQGENRVGYYSHDRLSAFEMGWKGRLYPESSGGAENRFLFTADGSLVALPVARRQKVTVREEWSSGDVELMPVVYLRELLSDLPAHSDPNNVPLSEEQENQLAWLGVELQGLDRELARANGVSDLTSDGESGALVTYIYPDSPAGRAGVEIGDILLRLHVEGHPKPLEVNIEEERSGFESQFWDNLDEVPLEYFDRLPKPWPSAENTFTRALTDVGFGTKYAAEFFRDGKTLKHDFEVIRGPDHYDSSPRYKSEPLGLTARDLTYEIRRYFQKEADDPGVIVSKIEPGSKAAVAGVRPYEIITHVNDTPVADVREFEKLIADQQQLRLSVNRKNQGRLVKIDTTTPASEGGALSKLRSSFRRMRGGQSETPDEAETRPAKEEEAAEGEE